jgi:lipopolysaccharide transport system permease protein
LLGLLIYASPVVLNENMVGPEAWNIVLLNPLSHIVLCFRDVFRAEYHPLSWGIFTAMTGICLVIGSFILTRAKLIINEYI